MQIIFETERLVLRSLTEDDFSFLASLYADPKVMRYTAGVKDRETFRVIFDGWCEHDAQYGYSFFAVAEKGDSSIIGRAGLFHLDQTEHIELGYSLAPQYWGKGYATELSKALINYGFEDLGLKEIYAVCKAINTPSINVMKKSGLHYVGKDDYYEGEVVVYKIQKDLI